MPSSRNFDSTVGKSKTRSVRPGGGEVRRDRVGREVLRQRPLGDVPGDVRGAPVADVEQDAALPGRAHLGQHPAVRVEDAVRRRRVDVRDDVARAHQVEDVPAAATPTARCAPSPCSPSGAVICRARRTASRSLAPAAFFDSRTLMPTIAVAMRLDGPPCGARRRAFAMSSSSPTAPRPFRPVRPRFSSSRTRLGAAFASASPCRRSPRRTCRRRPGS